MAEMAVTHGGNIFAIARERGWDWRDVLDFSACINPLGPSRLVREAICRSIDRIAHYPDREPVRLHAALAQAWRVSAEQVLCGNGATELISFLARVCGETNVALATPVFSEFHRLFPSATFVDLLREQEWPRQGLLVVTRPANPTGWTLPLENLDAYLSSSSALVLVDESFIDFTSAPSATRLLGTHPRLVILRSLTKFYALPGLRLGALIGHEDRIRGWRSLREPWQVNVLAEEAGLAALRDEEHAKSSLQMVEKERAWLFSRIQLLPKATLQHSSANYLFVRLDHSAEDLAAHLLERKILIRNCAAWPGITGEAVRIAVRTPSENERLLAAWREFPYAGSAGV
jgi:threonine-phosphate decarboxylase